MHSSWKSFCLFLLLWFYAWNKCKLLCVSVNKCKWFWCHNRLTTSAATCLYHVLTAVWELCGGGGCCWQRHLTVWWGGPVQHLHHAERTCLTPESTLEQHRSGYWGEYMWVQLYSIPGQKVAFDMCVTSHLLYGINYSYYYLFIIAWISTAKLTVSQPNAAKWANIRLYNCGMQTSQRLSLHFNVLRTVLFYNTQNISLSVSLSLISSQTVRWATKIGTQVHLRSLKVLSYIRHYDVA